MLIFRTWIFAGLVAFAACTLGAVSVGIRWHVYRAHASKYAREEMQHVFAAANFSRAASNPGYEADATEKAQSYQKLANMHTKAARECAHLRDFYERSW